MIRVCVWMKQDVSQWIYKQQGLARREEREANRTGGRCTQPLIVTASKEACSQRDVVAACVVCVLFDGTPR